MQFHIENMSCGGCARSVTKAIQSVDATADVKTDPPTRRVEVVTTSARALIEAALVEAGYPAIQIQSAS